MPGGGGPREGWWRSKPRFSVEKRTADEVRSAACLRQASPGGALRERGWSPRAAPGLGRTAGPLEARLPSTARRSAWQGVQGPEGRGTQPVGGRGRELLQRAAGTSRARPPLTQNGLLVSWVLSASWRS